MMRTFGFWVFSEGIKWDYWPEMGCKVKVNLCNSFIWKPLIFEHFHGVEKSYIGAKWYIFLLFQAVKYVFTLRRCLKDHEKGQQKNRSTGRENRGPKFYGISGPRFHENWGPKFLPDGTLDPGFEINPCEFYAFKLWLFLYDVCFRDLRNTKRLNRGNGWLLWNSSLGAVS